MSVRNGPDHTLPRGCSPAAGSHRRIGTTFIDENQLPRIYLGDPGPKLFAQCFDPWCLTFTGMQRLFLSGNPSFANARQIVLRLTAGPPAWINASRNSSNVASRFRSTQCRNRSSLKPSSNGGGPFPFG